MRLGGPLRSIASALVLTALSYGFAHAAEKRIALVVGNAAYAAGALATPANDAGLVAQTLQAAGFDVAGARDLNEDALRKALRDFVDKAAASGPDTVAVLYMAGYGLQLEGENYFAPVDLRVNTAADVGLRALRISDYTKGLAALPLKARFVILDGARRSPFAVPGKPLAGGLALTEAEPGSLIAFNAAPGTVGPDEKGPYGAYAQALVEMIRDGGAKPGPLFERVRLRVDEATKGAEVPWNADRTDDTVVFLERAADAPTIGQLDKVTALRDRPLRDLGARDAYAVCLARDDLSRYQEFVADYADDALARRVRALIAARREALVWRRTWLVGTPDAYWSYLDRYPRGPHAWDARRRLASLAAAYEPPPRFAAIAYDVPPPPPEEIVYVDRPVIYLADPVYALPPPPPLYFLPPQPTYLVALAPPPPAFGLFVLPTPPIVAVPSYVYAPSYVAPPPNNIVFQNIHNTTVIEQINRQNLSAPAAGGIGGAVAGAAVGGAMSRVALPAGLSPRAAGGTALPAAPLPNAPSAPFPGRPPGLAAPSVPAPNRIPSGVSRLRAGPAMAAPAYGGRAQTGPRLSPQDPRAAGLRLSRPSAPPPAEYSRRQDMFARRAVDQQAIAAQRQQRMQARGQRDVEFDRPRPAMPMQRAPEMGHPRPPMMQQPPLREPPRTHAFGGHPMMGQPPVPAARPAPPPPPHNNGGHPPCRPGQPCH